jgi:hypothetical protein
MDCVRMTAAVVAVVECHDVRVILAPDRISLPSGAPGAVHR